uniref:Uncharacterized protein n=1 Tax=Avena sativa TaxID=4498 RepID=A0ACD5Z1B5_AVESA
MKYSCQFFCQTNPLFALVTYFTLISFAGYEALKALKSQDKSNTLQDLDVSFTAVSASTVSSMATVEMEDLSSTQLWILAILMLVGSELLVGNTLFAPCFRFMVWSLQKITGKEEWHFILQHPEAIGYKHLMSTRKCVYLISTVVSFIILQAILFCSMEWSSEAWQDMSSYQKIVGALFQSANARHAGESIVDLSSVSSAILVLYTVMIAYGNVGFSVGYSCKRLLKQDVYCKDASYGFVGKWSDKGKLILIIVMVFGRLKAFNLKGGRAWKLR